MSFGSICLAIAMVLFFLLGFHIVDPSTKYNLDEIGWGFIAAGLLLGGILIPMNFTRGPRREAGDRR